MTGMSEPTPKTHSGSSARTRRMPRPRGPARATTSRAASTVWTRQVIGDDQAAAVRVALAACSLVVRYYPTEARRAPRAAQVHRRHDGRDPALARRSDARAARSACARSLDVTRDAPRVAGRATTSTTSGSSRRSITRRSPCGPASARRTSCRSTSRPAAARIDHLRAPRAARRRRVRGSRGRRHHDRRPQRARLITRGTASRSMKLVSAARARSAIDRRRAEVPGEAVRASASRCRRARTRSPPGSGTIVARHDRRDQRGQPLHRDGARTRGAARRPRGSRSDISVKLRDSCGRAQHVLEQDRDASR